MATFVIGEFDVDSWQTIMEKSPSIKVTNQTLDYQT